MVSCQEQSGIAADDYQLLRNRNVMPGTCCLRPTGMPLLLPASMTFPPCFFIFSAGFGFLRPALCTLYLYPFPKVNPHFVLITGNFVLSVFSRRSHVFRVIPNVPPCHPERSSVSSRTFFRVILNILPCHPERSEGSLSPPTQPPDTFSAPQCTFLPSGSGSYWPSQYSRFPSGRPPLPLPHLQRPPPHSPVRSVPHR